MKSLLICEQRDGRFLDSNAELLSFAERLKSEKVLLLIGSKDALPAFERQTIPGRFKQVWRVQPGCA